MATVQSSCEVLYYSIDLLISANFFSFFRFQQILKMDCIWILNTFILDLSWKRPWRLFRAVTFPAAFWRAQRAMDHPEDQGEGEQIGLGFLPHTFTLGFGARLLRCVSRKVIQTPLGFLSVIWTQGSLWNLSSSGYSVQNLGRHITNIAVNSTVHLGFLPRVRFHWK